MKMQSTESKEPSPTYKFDLSGEDLQRFVGGSYCFTHRETGYSTSTRATIKSIDLREDGAGHTLSFELLDVTCQGVNNSFTSGVAPSVGQEHAVTDPAAQRESIRIPRDKFGWEVGPFVAGGDSIYICCPFQGDSISISIPEPLDAPLPHRRY
jgi:hypothetical protein